MPFGTAQGFMALTSVFDEWDHLLHFTTNCHIFLLSGDSWIAADFPQEIAGVFFPH